MPTTTTTSTSFSSFLFLSFLPLRLIFSASAHSVHHDEDEESSFSEVLSLNLILVFIGTFVGYLITMLADVMISYVYGKEKSVSAAAVDGGGRDVELQGGTEPRAKANLGDIIFLIVTLCSHSVFEGIAIGVLETKADAWRAMWTMWRALWTMSLLTVFVAIAIGIALLRMKPDRPLFSCVSYAFAFAISSPIGVAIGIVINATTQGQVADWIFVISKGLECGVVIYVSISILKGYTPLKATLVDKAHYKFLAVMLGIGVIAVLMIWD